MRTATIIRESGKWRVDVSEQGVWVLGLANTAHASCVKFAEWAEARVISDEGDDSLSTEEGAKK